MYTFSSQKTLTEPTKPILSQASKDVEVRVVVTTIYKSTLTLHIQTYILRGK